MAAVKARDVDRVLRRLDPQVFLLLFYGPDTGLVSERARAAAESAVSDPADPFQLVRLEGDAVAADPGRLADEVGTIPLFGGRRAIWIKSTTRNLVPAVEATLATGGQDVMVVVEGGDLGRTSPLRLACERSPRSLALPCFSDTGADLGTVIDGSLREAGAKLAPEARETLLASLGGDRLATRREVEKLLLYARGQPVISLADVDAVVSNVSGLALDAVVDAAFAGEGSKVDSLVGRAREAGLVPSAILGQALRHGLALFAASTDSAVAGKSPRTAVESWRGLHFTRKDVVARQLGLWAPDPLRAAINELQGAVLRTRQMPDLADALASAALLGIARRARASRSRARLF